MSKNERAWWTDPRWTREECVEIEELAELADDELTATLESLESTVGPVGYWLEDYWRYLERLLDDWKSDWLTAEDETKGNKPKAELARILQAVAGFYEESLESWVSEQNDFICGNLRAVSDQVTWTHNHE